MSTQTLSVGQDWINIVSVLNLEAGVAYYIQNTADSELVYSFKPTEPEEDDGKHILLPYRQKDFFVFEDSAFWVKIKRVGGINKNVRITVSSDRTILATESNGGVPVNIRDQITRPIIAKFNQVQNSTTLAEDAVKGEYTIVVSVPTGAIAGRYLIIFEPSTENFSFYTILGVVTNTITLDTQLDFAYSIGAFVDFAITNLNVDGEDTPRTFGLRGASAPPGVGVIVDITRLIFKGITDGVPALDTFGDIDKLPRGLVLRTSCDDVVQNIFNVKDNGEFAGIMYDWQIVSALNPAQGVNGFYGRMTFAGQHKIGVAIRLSADEDLELIVQDDLRDLTLLEVVAEGHLLFE